jgi:hypothetical protein
MMIKIKTMRWQALLLADAKTLAVHRELGQP